jgi:tetratricopeptide (TPR) repeat protein
MRAQPICHLNLAQLTLLTGAWAETQRHIERAEELARAMDRARVAELIVLHARGQLALRRGEWDTARELLEMAVEQATGALNQIVVLAQADLGELDILQGTPESARDRLLALVETREINIRPLLAWALLELDEALQALDEAETCERDVRERQELFDLPEVLRIKGMVLARLGRLGEAMTTLTEARERAQTMPIPYTEGRILVELALIRREEGDYAGARALLEEARTVFRRLGAGKDAERIEQLLQDSAAAG